MSGTGLVRLHRGARSPGLDAPWRIGDGAHRPGRAGYPEAEGGVSVAPVSVRSARWTGPAARADRLQRPAARPDGPGFRLRGGECGAPAHGGADRPDAAG